MSEERRSKDQRQWARFPIDMHLDAKIMRLDVAVRWTFVEMNFEARREANDGVFGKDDAEFRWPAEHLTALCKSHPSEPLVIASNDTYVLRRYAQHQFTEADRAELKAKRSSAGKAGADARWNGKSMAPDSTAIASATDAVASVTVSDGNRMANDGKACQESESESEVETDTPRPSQVSQEGNRARIVGLTDQGIVSIVKSVELHCDLDVSAYEAEGFAGWIVAKSTGPVKHPAAYVRNAVEASPSDTSMWFLKHRRHLKAVGNA